MNPVAASAPAPRLLDQLREKIRYKHYSVSTEKLYLYWVRFFIRWSGLRHPLEMCAVEIRFPALKCHLYSMQNTRVLNKGGQCVGSGIVANSESFALISLSGELRLATLARSFNRKEKMVSESQRRHQPAWMSSFFQVEGAKKQG